MTLPVQTAETMGTLLSTPGSRLGTLSPSFGTTRFLLWIKLFWYCTSLLVNFLCLPMLTAEYTNLTKTTRKEDGNKMHEILPQKLPQMLVFPETNEGSLEALIVFLLLDNPNRAPVDHVIDICLLPEKTETSPCSY